MKIFRKEFGTEETADLFMSGVQYVSEAVDEVARYVAHTELEPVVVILRDSRAEDLHALENAKVIAAICNDLGLDASDIYEICQPLDINPHNMTAQQAAEYALGGVCGGSDWDDPDWLAEQLVHRAEYGRIRDKQWAEDLAARIEDLIREEIPIQDDLQPRINELAQAVQRVKLEFMGW